MSKEIKLKELKLKMTEIKRKSIERISDLTDWIIVNQDWLIPLTTVAGGAMIKYVKMYRLRKRNTKEVRYYTPNCDTIIITF